MVTWLVLGLAWAAPQPLSLDDVLRAAGDLSNTPYAEQIRADTAQARLTQARSPDELNLRLMEAGITPATTRPSTEVRLRMPTEAFGLLRARANLARATDEVEAWEAAAYRLEAQAAAHVSFVQLQLYRLQIATLDDELSAHEQRVALFERRLASGLTTTDVHAEALGDQLSVQRERFRIQAASAQSRAQLASWTRLELSEASPLTAPPITELGAAPLDPLESYLQGLGNHPLLRQGQAIVHASEAKRIEEAREAAPSIRYVQADATFEGGQSPEVAAMLGVELPLFAGARADVHMARAESAKAQSQMELLQHQLEREVTGSWQAAQALQQLWQQAGAHAERLEKTLLEMTEAGDPVAVADLRVRALRAKRRAQEDLARYLEARLDLEYTAAVSQAAVSQEASSPEDTP